MILIEVDSHGRRRKVEMVVGVEYSFQTRYDGKSGRSEVVEVGELNAEL